MRRSLHCLVVLALMTVSPVACSTGNSNSDGDPDWSMGREVAGGQDVQTRPEDSRGQPDDSVSVPDEAGLVDQTGQPPADTLADSVEPPEDTVEPPEDTVEPEDEYVLPDTCDCSGVECGLVSEGCFCGSCPDGEVCTEAGQCTVIACNFDGDCPTGSYCPWSYDGATDPASGLPTWSNVCMPQKAGGVPQGGECGEGLPKCANVDMCQGDYCTDTYCEPGYCSATCLGDDDCVGDQLCTVYEFLLDLDEDGYGDQALPGMWCQDLPGSQSVCFSENSCPAGETCRLSEKANYIAGGELHPDGPYLVGGHCSKDIGVLETGDGCLYGEECKSGWCLFADPENGVAGLCTQVCDDVGDCPQKEFNGQTYFGYCASYYYSPGGDTGVVETDNYFGLCSWMWYSPSACDSDYGCDMGEGCFPFSVAYGPDQPPVTTLLCLDEENTDGSMPTLETGNSCNPYLEDGDGYQLNQCKAGWCFADGSDQGGYCTRMCNPDNNMCSAYDPTMKCLSISSIPRKGAYAQNSVSWQACLKDEECSICTHSGWCPGNRECVNVGKDDDMLADWRCLDACQSDGDCSGSLGSKCNLAKDYYGTEHKACFDMGGLFPVNPCY